MAFYFGVALSIFLSIAFSNCKGSDPKTVSTDPDRPPADVSKTEDTFASDSEPTRPSDPFEGEKLVRAIYDLRVNAILGMEVCRGELVVSMPATFGNSGQIFSTADLVESGQLRCLFGLVQMDTGQMLAMLGQGGSTGSGSSPDSGVVVEDDVIRFKQLGPVSFSPNRPMLPAIFSADRDDLDSISVFENVLAKNQENGKTAEGTISLQILSSGSPFAAPMIDYVFQDTLTFENAVEGFGDNKMDFLLFDMEMTWSLNPVAVPQIKIVGKVGDLMKTLSKGGQGGVGGFFGGPSGGAPVGSGGGIIGGFIQGFVASSDYEIHLNLVAMDGLADREKSDENPSRDEEG